MVQLPFCSRTTPAKGVGEPDAALAVSGDVIAPVVAASVQLVGQGGDGAIRFKARDAVVAALASIQAAAGIEHLYIGGIRLCMVLGVCARLRVLAENAVPGNMGKQERLAIPSRPFRGAA